jgi:hypothetical protein
LFKEIKTNTPSLLGKQKAKEKKTNTQAQVWGLW